MPETLSAGLPPAAVTLLRETFAQARLGQKDSLLYQHLFSLSAEHRWDEFDRMAAGLPTSPLLDWLRASRLTDPKYKPLAGELSAWLDRNEFMPQAAAIHKRLAAIDRDLAASYAPLAGPAPIARGGFRQPLDYYANMTASQRAVMDGVLEQFAARRYGLAYKSSARLARDARQVLPGAWWIAGISAWHLGNLANADHGFRMIIPWARGQGEHDWAAQSSYWASRVASRTGDTAAADRLLAGAAREEETFYGLLASSALKQPPVDIRKPALGVIATAAMLTDIGRADDAGSLLRESFDSLKPVEQQAMMWSAAELKLAGLPLPVSRLPNAALLSHYPLPEWRSRLSVDASLVLAVVRRESGFDPSAGSGAGAQGLMQIMPATADYMIRQQNALGIETADSSDKGYLVVAKYRSFGLKNVDVNLAVGQAYLRYLGARPEIGGSLIRLLASYNAGPGTLQGWTPERDENDPLLFIESIPLRETRDYVRNVLTDSWIYGTLLAAPPASLSTLSQNRWPEFKA